MMGTLTPPPFVSSVAVILVIVLLFYLSSVDVQRLPPHRSYIFPNPSLLLGLVHMCVEFPSHPSTSKDMWRESREVWRGNGGGRVRVGVKWGGGIFI